MLRRGHILAIFVMGIISITFLPIYAQSLSDLERQLDEENLERVKAISEGERQEPTFAKVNCLPGQIEKAISGGGITCVNDPNSQFNIDENTGYAVFGVIIVIIIIIIVAAKSKSKGEEVVERKEFSYSTRDAVKKIQDGKCDRCKNFPTHWEFHHKGSRDDNSIENCQGLCRDCHEDLTIMEEKDQHSKV